MSKHIFYFGHDLSKLKVVDEHRQWLNRWLEVLLTSIEEGKVAASECLQGALIEEVLKSPLRTDWKGVFDTYLKSSDGLPMAYSEAYGKQLHNFTAQFEQVTVHSLHTFWFINKLLDENFTSSTIVDAFKSFWQPSGWFYNPHVSVTTERYRMRAELFMNIAMAAEVLVDSGLDDAIKEKLHVQLLHEPLTDYLSAEYFRLVSQNILQKEAATGKLNKGLEELIISCRLEGGYSDFNVKNKVDDYMGTAKRVGRDVAVVSAISTLHAKDIASLIKVTSADLDKAIEEMNASLRANPLGLLAFKMRDLEPNFGPAISPHEIIAASILRTGQDT